MRSNPAPPAPAAAGPAAAERGPNRRLGIGQQVMMAMGGAFGTGLFLGSGLAAGGPGYGRLSSAAGALLVPAIFVSTWWIPGLRATILAGGPRLLLLTAGYLVTGPSQQPRAPRQSA